MKMGDMSIIRPDDTYFNPGREAMISIRVWPKTFTLKGPDELRRAMKNPSRIVFGIAGKRVYLIPDENGFYVRSSDRTKDSRGGSFDGLFPLEAAPLDPDFKTGHYLAKHDAECNLFYFDLSERVVQKGDYYVKSQSNL